MDKLLKLWPILLAVVGGIVLWGNLPKQVAKLEAGQAQQGEELDDLKGWAREIQGYTRAQQELNQAVQHPQAPRGRTFNDRRHPEETRPWVEVDEELLPWCCWEATEADCDDRESWEICGE